MRIKDQTKKGEAQKEQEQEEAKEGEEGKEKLFQRRKIRAVVDLH